MQLSRRNLLRATLAATGAAALTTTGALSTAAVAALRSAGTTLARTYVPAPANAEGYSKVVVGPGDPHTVRTDLGIAARSTRSKTRRNLLAFAQLSDVHMVDHQSPARVEWVDRYDDPNATGQVPGLFASAYRPQEMLSAQVGDAMVRAVNAIKRAPVTGLRLAYAIQTGDNADNCQHNEIRWNIDVLDGGRIVPDSGSRLAYEGVMDQDPLYYDPHYWHPGAPPLGKSADRYKSQYGFPTIANLLNASRRAFDAVGLNVPWYTCFGNHDGLAQGNFPPNTMQTSTLATGSVKVISPPPGIAPADVLDPEGSTLEQILGGLVVSPYAKLVSPDLARRHLSRGQIVDEHFATSGLPVGHGFTDENRANDTAYYFFDQGLFRHVVMDTVNPNGYSDGSLDPAQFAWLQATVAGASGRVVIVYSHHSSSTMDNPFVATGGDLGVRVLGAEVTSFLLSQQRVIAWVNGHSHRNQIKAHARDDGSGGFWEINTAAHIDWPQQARIIEVTDNLDGTLSIFTTVIDHAGAADYAGDLTTTTALASLSRELSVNDPHANLGASGGAGDRNTELLVAKPSDA